MNLAPAWCEAFFAEGWESRHWSTVGDPRATDGTIMEWARANGYVVFTHDLDFGTLLALTQDVGPSVVQLRAQDVLPENRGDVVVRALHQFETALQAGALVVIDEARARVRVLPLRQPGSEG